MRHTISSILSFLALLPFFCIVGCSSESPSAQSKEDAYRPSLPAPLSEIAQGEVGSTSSTNVNPLDLLPLSKSDPRAKQFFSDILEHPWILAQPHISTLSRLMVEDIRSLSHAYALRSAQMQKIGVTPPSYQEEANFICRHLQRLQRKIEALSLEFPHYAYSLLNLPAINPTAYSTPLPFNIHKRVHLGSSTLGMPIFLDVRVFELDAHKEREARDRDIKAIIAWHTDLLEGGETNFKKLDHTGATVLIGHGKRNMAHFDNAHGFNLEERGVFLACLKHQMRLYILHVDAPYSSFQELQEALLQILPQKKALTQAQ